MAQYNFEGDIDNLTERQLEFINNVIVGLGYENSKVTFEPVGKAGDNYLAFVKRITIEGEKGNLSIIAKIAASQEMHRQATNSALLFRNEHIMYNDFLPKLVQLQKDAGVPEHEQLKYAKMYGSLTEEPNELILLEDLKTLNFAMLDRFTSLTDDCVKSVLKNFAIFHSLSFVLREKDPETYDHFKENLRVVWTAVATFDPMQKYFQGLEDDTLSILQDPKHIDLVRHKVGDMINCTIQYMKSESNSRYTVIQQGDSWTNNIMFRFEEDKVVESIMIDYQLSKNNSPVCDVMYMIFNCTDYKTRRQNFYDWIDYYHLELEKSLFIFDFKANYIYPRDKLDADMKRYGRLMFGMCICLANLLIRKSEDVEKLKDNVDNDDLFKNVEEFSIMRLDEETKTRYMDRILGLINSFTEFGLL